MVKTWSSIDWLLIHLHSRLLNRIDSLNQCVLLFGITECNNVLLKGSFSTNGSSIGRSLGFMEHELLCLHRFLHSHSIGIALPNSKQSHTLIESFLCRYWGLNVWKKKQSMFSSLPPMVQHSPLVGVQITHSNMGVLTTTNMCLHKRCTSHLGYTIYGTSLFYFWHELQERNCLQYLVSHMCSSVTYP